MGTRGLSTSTCLHVSEIAYTRNEYSRHGVFCDIVSGTIGSFSDDPIRLSNGRKTTGLHRSISGTLSSEITDRQTRWSSL